MLSLIPWSAVVGGALIGLGASVLLLASGRIAGISGILGGLLLPKRGEVSWRAFFILGLLGGGALIALFAPERLGASPASLAVVALSGLLVGFGTRVGSGCTSGHGVCGVSRLSARSLLATLTFIATGVATVAIVRLLGGVS